MGCWNQTCGITQLHIRANQPVMVFAMVKQDKVDSLCYTTPFYKPVLMPFYANYNDYGGGEDCTGPGLELLMKGIREQLVELEVGDNEYHDIAVKKDNFDVDLFFEACHERRLFVNGLHERSRRHVEFVMIHQDIADHILQKRRVESYVGEGLGTTGWGNSYVEYGFADVLADLPACVDMLFKNMNSKDDMLARYDPLRRLTRSFDRTETANRAVRYFSYNSYNYSQLVNVEDIVLECVDADDRERLIVLLTEFLKAIWIDDFMSETRKFWSPQAGAGSQRQESEPYELLIAAMTSVLDAEKREYAEENDEAEIVDTELQAV